MTATFAPPRGIDRGSSMSLSNPGQPISGDSGAEQRRNRHVRPLREYNMSWSAATQDQADYIRDFFFTQMEGRDDAFYWSAPEYVPSPLSSAPAVTSTASGALAQQTYKISYTWYDGSGETKPSQETTFLKPLNHMLVVTVPIWPATGITGWRLYDSNVPLGRFASVTSGTTWTQSGALSSGAAKPTENTLQVASKWRLTSSIAMNPLGLCKYSISFTIREVTQ